ncbi:SDR family NAD(P)-dependent oxidoreductase [Phycicoccus sp. CMS6Z-2]|uniref:SDR family NAD(P)-dependent oxidoreductase n=1 Tax=Phycicoccus flavus TaxID=2502783 RepID=A0A8T6R640_9MICO|nr:SDR family NAD(P)-dependent oxidoreductase [Phycicoccus flavus]
MAVVGASGALGSRIARGAAERGATVVLVGRDAERLGEVVDGASVVVGDLGDATLGDRLLETATDAHGGLDGVVNAAGVAAFGDLVDTDDAVIEELFLTNVVGPLFLARRVLPALAERRGFLVNLSAVLAEQPMAGMAAYSASKAALTAADRALTKELRRRHVDVVDVRPPHTETGLVDRGLAGTAPRLPEGLDPDVVARAVLDAVEQGRPELASDDIG